MTEKVGEEIERLTGYILSPDNFDSHHKFDSPRGSENYQKALEHSMCVNNRLSLETKTLKKQLSSAEGEATYLQKENESLKKQLEDLENGKFGYSLPNN